jgi:leader peptidase (prepilin peptidase)/N-methyltransferase
MTTYIVSAALAVLGLAVGSFLNVCIDRLPADESVVRLPSHCASCKRKLQWRYLVPVFSYLWLRGRCRYCGAHIPLRILLVELATAIIFGLLTWHYGLSPQLVMALIYACLFLITFVIDLERQLILYAVIFPAMALAFIFSFFWDGFGAYWPHIANAHLDGMASALLGGAMGLVFMILPYLISRMHYGTEGMGQGDIYLAALIGLATGFPLVIVALIMGIIVGGVVAVSLLLLKLKKRKDPIPFGPFLAAAAMVTLIWGVQILDWYSGLM